MMKWQSGVKADHVFVNTYSRKVKKTDGDGRMKPNGEGGHVILVSDSDPVTQRNKVQKVVNMMEIELGEGWIFHKFCKMFLFVSSQRVVGCIIAEPIKEAFRVLSCSVSERCNGAEAKKRKSSSTTLQFGIIILQREVVKRAPDNCSQLPEGNHQGAIISNVRKMLSLLFSVLQQSGSLPATEEEALPPNCLMP